MDRFATVVAAALLTFCGSVSAGYAQLAPPPGWSSGAGATYGTIPARAAANGASFWSSSSVINAGGRSVTVPVAGRFAANAGRFAARGLALNPLALGVAGAAWLASECIGYQGGSWVRTCGPDLPPPPEPSDGFEYGISGQPQYYPTASQGCAAMMAYVAPGMYWVTLSAPYAVGLNCYAMGQGQAMATGTLDKRVRANCPAGWYQTSAGCVATPPPLDTKTLTPQQVEEIMAPKTIPPGVYPEIPNVPLPIEAPRINPSPAPDLTPRPLVIPQGDPVKVPNSNPTRWTQPEVQITPAPTPDSPFQVDIKPQDRPVGDPLTNPPIREPWTPPVKPPVVNPNDPPVEPEPDPNKDPVEKTPDLCEKYPDILACQTMKLGELEAQKIKNTEVPLKIEKESGFPSGGQCPAPKVVALMGKSFSFTIEPLCDFAKAIKPLLLGFAYLTAALTFLGVARRE